MMAEDALPEYDWGDVSVKGRRLIGAGSFREGGRSEQAASSSREQRERNDGRARQTNNIGSPFYRANRGDPVSKLSRIDAEQEPQFTMKNMKG